jgi:hypothetical protein
MLVVDAWVSSWGITPEIVAIEQNTLILICLFYHIKYLLYREDFSPHFARKMAMLGIHASLVSGHKGQYCSINVGTGLAPVRKRVDGKHLSDRGCRDRALRRSCPYSFGNIFTLVEWYWLQGHASTGG